MICKGIIKNYLTFLEESFHIEETPNGCRIITPFIGFNGESITFYIEQQENFLKLTDKGNTLIDLEIKHIQVDSDKEKEIFDEILKLYEVYEESGKIVVYTDENNLAYNLSLYINALQSLYSMEYMTPPARLKPFNKTVREYCKLNKLEHKYLLPIKIGTMPYTIDIMSIDFKNLIQTVGTSIDVRSHMRTFTKEKMVPFLTLELEKYAEEKKKYYRVAIYEDELSWDDESLLLMTDYSDDIIKWTDRKKLEPLLTVKS